MRNRRIALITGITGQDGAYLAEFLLDKGYEVHGIKRRASLNTDDRLPLPGFLHHGDMTDSNSLIRIIQQVHNLMRSIISPHKAMSHSLLRNQSTPLTMLTSRFLKRMANRHEVLKARIKILRVDAGAEMVDGLRKATQ